MSSVEGRTVYNFQECVANQAPHKARFVAWLSNRPKVAGVEEASREDDLGGRVEGLVMIDEQVT
jgi:hypothetical protein